MKMKQIDCERNELKMIEIIACRKMGKINDYNHRFRVLFWIDLREAFVHNKIILDWKAKKYSHVSPISCSDSGIIDRFITWEN